MITRRLIYGVLILFCIWLVRRRAVQDDKDFKPKVISRPSSSLSSPSSVTTTTTTFADDQEKTDGMSAGRATVGDLHEQAKKSHTAMLLRQSKTVAAARTEYVRRYSMQPPSGFDEWVNYAIDHKSLIIDEFDELMDGLRPFRKFREESCDLSTNTTAAPAVVVACVKDGALLFPNPLNRYDTKQIATPLQQLLSDFVAKLPDMCFDINTFDEPRQVIPPSKQEALLAGTASPVCQLHEFLGYKRKSTWSDIIVSCPEDSPAKTGKSLRNDDQAILANSWKDVSEICSYTSAPPSGMIRCPENFSGTSGGRPLLSAASLATFSDIMFPTLWRWRFNIDDPKSTTFTQMQDETPWAAKHNTVGWRGTSTGGYAANSDWRHFQRHQMVLFANGSTDRTINDPEQLKEWLDVRFTSVTGCDPKTCEDIKNTVAVLPATPLSDTFKSKIVLDMDGHGLSGRFYMLLQSYSAVMKQGLVREWHDSRIVPWLHYIPLSMQMSEMEEVLQYFFNTGTQGDKVLETIGREGRDWVRSSLRKEDMRIYMYRLLLELGRRDFT